MDKMDKLVINVCIFGLIYFVGHLLIAIMKGSI